jgi:hypothetical protein
MTASMELWMDAVRCEPERENFPGQLTSTHQLASACITVHTVVLNDGQRPLLGPPSPSACNGNARIQPSPKGRRRRH